MKLFRSALYICTCLCLCNAALFPHVCCERHSHDGLSFCSAKCHGGCCDEEGSCHGDADAVYSIAAASASSLRVEQARGPAGALAVLPNAFEGHPIASAASPPRGAPPMAGSTLHFLPSGLRAPPAA